MKNIAAKVKDVQNLLSNLLQYPDMARAISVLLTPVRNRIVGKKDMAITIAGNTVVNLVITAMAGTSAVKNDLANTNFAKVIFVRQKDVLTR